MAGITQMDASARDNYQVGKHKLVLESRKKCNITGVVDAVSFDEKAVVLETVDGMLTLNGNDMHVSRLNLEKGEVDLEGKVDSVIYTEKNTFAKKGESLLTRLFS